MFVIACLAIHLVYASSTPTPEEIITRQIEMNGQAWQELENEKNQYIERIGEIEEKQIILHEQSNGLRSFFLPETARN